MCFRVCTAGVISAAVVLGGCATVSDTDIGKHAADTAQLLRDEGAKLRALDKQYPADKDFTASAADKAQKDQKSEDVRQIWERAVQICAVSIQGLEARAQKAGTAQFLVAAVGTIAGAVIAPALTAGSYAKTAVAGWSGLSGVANASQKSVGDYFYSAPDLQQSREALIRDIHSLSDDFNKKGATPDDQIAAAYKLIDRCQFYALLKAAAYSTPGATTGKPETGAPGSRTPGAGTPGTPPPAGGAPRTGTQNPQKR
jgi:hypothetical protein